MTGAERSATAVFESHLALTDAGRGADDIRTNFSPDCVVLTSRGTFRGRDGLNRLAEALDAELPGARYHYETKVVEGDVAFLEWSAECDKASVHDGADSFVIRDGLIIAQTIHYSLSVRAPTTVP
jgi:hypothetical protein